MISTVDSAAFPPTASHHAHISMQRNDGIKAGGTGSPGEAFVMRGVRVWEQCEAGGRELITVFITEDRVFPSSQEASPGPV